MKHKLKDWIKRYYLAEIISTVMTVVAAISVNYFFRNPILTAYTGSLAGSISYYFILIYQRAFHKQRASPIHPGMRLYKALKEMVLEFGPSELLDSFLFRPMFLYVIPKYIQNETAGYLLGKLAGDITFYVPVLLSYELRKNHKIKKQQK
jgi:hypothetical protein